MKSIDWNKVEAGLMQENYPDFAIEQTLIKLREIDQLRQQKNAVLLAHYYQIPPIQMIADFTGDSLALAQQAKQLKDTDLVISSTVYFMAEMVKMLSPEKKVVIPAPDASCSIAEGMNAAVVRRIREVFPDAGLVAYINTTAAVKAEVDVTCTSANADMVALRMPQQQVIMLPDHYFAENIISALPENGKRYLSYRGINSDTIILYEPKTATVHTLPLHGTEKPILSKGTCIVHEQFAPGYIEQQRRMKSADIILAHPEVHPDTAKAADFVGGTGKMMDFVGAHPEYRRVMVLTECDLIAPLRQKYPDREYVTPCQFCRYMKRNTLDMLLYAFQAEQTEVTVDPTIAARATRAMEYMFELTKH